MTSLVIGMSNSLPCRKDRASDKHRQLREEFFHLSARLNRRNLICLLGSYATPGNRRIKRALREKARLPKHIAAITSSSRQMPADSDQHVPDCSLLSLRFIRLCLPLRRMRHIKAPTALLVQAPRWNSIRQKPALCWVNWAFYQSDLYTLQREPEKGVTVHLVYF